MSNVNTYTLGQAETEAVELGAVACYDYYVNYQGERIVYSKHYFNEHKKEVGLIILDMLELCGLSVFIEPRVWADYYFQEGSDYKWDDNFRERNNF